MNARLKNLGQLGTQVCPLLPDSGTPTARRNSLQRMSKFFTVSSLLPQCCNRTACSSMSRTAAGDRKIALHILSSFAHRTG